MNKKKTYLLLISAILVTILMCSITTYAAEPEIKILLNGNEIKSEVAPIIINGSTLVPVRAIFEALGVNVDWNGDTETVIGTKDGIKIVMQIDSTSVFINDQPKTIEVPAMIIDGSTMIPVRFVSETLGLKVDFESNTKTVLLTSVVPTLAPTPSPTPSPTPIPIPKKIENENYTEDGVKITYYNGRKYVELSDIDARYHPNCFPIIYSSQKTIKIFGSSHLFGLDIDFIKPVVETQNYVNVGNDYLFDLDYYENNMRPILQNPKSEEYVPIKKDGLNIYIYNNIEYIRLQDIDTEDNRKIDATNYDKITTLSGFRYDKNSKVISLEGYALRKGFIKLIPEIPYIRIDGHACLEYAYYKDTILPLISKYK